MAMIITPLPADYTAQREALSLLLTRLSPEDYTAHPDGLAFTRIRAAVAYSDPAAHKTRTANSWDRSEKFNRRGALIVGDESFYECTCGESGHEVTRPLARRLARTHREKATRLTLDHHDVAALWCVLSGRWTPLSCWAAIRDLGAELPAQLRGIEYHDLLGRL